jgi:hypothetical protein
MKRLITISAIILFVTAGCGGDKQSTDDLITVDVTASYPKKELILQDFMDVEYIPLETTDTFLCQGLVLAIGKNMLAARNYVNDGDIFLFNRKTGKGLRKINRKGQGGEEYTHVQRIVLDEDSEEMFVHDHFTRKIMVYDLEGNFKRSLKQNDVISFGYIYDFDHEKLIGNNSWRTDRPPFTIISKQDGNITNEIRIPFEKKISTTLEKIDEKENMTYSVGPRTYIPIIPYFNNWILVEQSADTIYKYQPDHTMTPFIARTPSVQSMDPEVFLFLSVLTNRYYFMETVKKEYDWGSDSKAGSGFPSTDLVYDKQEKAIFRYTIYNDDYSEKILVNMKTTPVNDEIASWQPLQASDLVEAYEKGQLKGRLKEIAANLNEESNPVLMLLKHKK